MARILTKNMTPIVIQEAPSGLEKLYNTVSNLAERYASPEYEQQQINNRQQDIDNKRQDARVELQINQFTDSKNRYADAVDRQDIIDTRKKETDRQADKIFSDNQKTTIKNNAGEYTKSQFEGLNPSDILGLNKQAFLIGLTDPSERLVAGKLYDKGQKKATVRVKQFNSRYKTFMDKNPDSKLNTIEAQSIFYDDELYKDFLISQYLEKKPDLTDIQLNSLDYFIKNKTGLEKQLSKYEEMQQSGLGDEKVLAENVVNAKGAIFRNESRIENLLKLNENEETTVDAYSKKTKTNKFSGKPPYSDEYLGDPKLLYTGNEPTYDILYREESDDEGMAEPALQLATESASSNEDIAFDTDFTGSTLISKEEFKKEVEDGNISDLDDAMYYNMFEKNKVPSWVEGILQTTRAEQNPSLNNIPPVLEAKEKNDKPVFTKKPPGTGDQRHVMKNRTMRLPKDGSRILKNKIKDIQKNLKYSEDMSSGNVEMKKNVKKKIPEKIKKLKSLFDSIYDNGAFYNPNNPQRDPDNKAFGVYEDFLSKEEIEYLKGL